MKIVDQVFHRMSESIKADDFLAAWQDAQDLSVVISATGQDPVWSHCPAAACFYNDLAEAYDAPF